MSILAEIKTAWPISQLFTAMYREFSTKNQSEKVYRVVVPMIKDYVNQGYTFKNPELKEAVEMLKGLAPVGAPRHNFERRYLVDERTLLDLPDNPDRLSPGYWW